ncbi:MAG: B12-binding domain-containing radical SAM protein [Candidatus Nealsonbacteria bacterium]|nr:B12-binding domain-containing radical SAM protein [Candidatus Nealsonbacteria bacterium]
MKLLLIMPSGSIHRHRSGNFKKVLRYAPLTLTTLAALVPANLGAEIRLIDEGVEPVPNDFDADLVGINAITGTAPRAYAIADRARSQGCTVVLGGVHPTLLPDEALLHSDAIVTGFAEQAWPQLLHDFSEGRMKRVYRAPSNPSLEGLPTPRRDLLCKNAYITVNSVYASRGCPNRCGFCVIPVAWGQRAYLRPIHEVIHEIEALDGRDLVLIDPNLIANRPYARQLFREMAPLRRRWYGLATTEITDDKELFDLLVRSGCKGLFIGFESVSQSTLNRINKGFNPVHRYKEIVRRLHDRGIAVQGAFVFGFDNDDPSVFERTVEVVAELKIDLPRYSVFTPFPGTPVFNRLSSQQRIFEKDWSLYDAQHVVFRPNRMTAEQLQEGLYRAWLETYKLSSIARRIVASRCTPLVSIAANLGYKYYAAKLSQFDNRTLVESNNDTHKDHAHHARSRVQTG